MKLLLSIPQTDLLDYPKLSQTYYVLLECLAQDHMAFLATLEPQVAAKHPAGLILVKYFYSGFPLHSGLNLGRITSTRW